MFGEVLAKPADLEGVFALTFGQTSGRRSEKVVGGFDYYMWQVLGLPVVTLIASNGDDPFRTEFWSDSIGLLPFVRTSACMRATSVFRSSVRSPRGVPGQK